MPYTPLSSAKRAAKPLKGFGGGTVLELVENYDRGTYRAVYAARFATKVYVLHAFRKKSKRRIATPRHDIELVRDRLKAAERLHRETSHDEDI